MRPKWSGKWLTKNIYLEGCMHACLWGKLVWNMGIFSEQSEWLKGEMDDNTITTANSKRNSNSNSKSNAKSNGIKGEGGTLQIRGKCCPQEQHTKTNNQRRLTWKKSVRGGGVASWWTVQELFNLRNRPTTLQPYRIPVENNLKIYGTLLPKCLAEPKARQTLGRGEVNNNNRSFEKRHAGTRWCALWQIRCRLCGKQSNMTHYDTTGIWYCDGSINPRRTSVVSPLMALLSQLVTLSGDIALEADDAPDTAVVLATSALASASASALSVSTGDGGDEGAVPVAAPSEKRLECLLRTGDEVRSTSANTDSESFASSRRVSRSSFISRSTPSLRSCFVHIIVHSEKRIGVGRLRGWGVAI